MSPARIVHHFFEELPLSFRIDDHEIPAVSEFLTAFTSGSEVLGRFEFFSRRCWVEFVSFVAVLKFSCSFADFCGFGANSWCFLRLLALLFGEIGVVPVWLILVIQENQVRLSTEILVTTDVFSEAICISSSN